MRDDITSMFLLYRLDVWIIWSATYLLKCLLMHHVCVTVWYLFLRTQWDSFEPPEVEAGVGLGISRPLQGKLPAASPPLLPDFTQVGLDGKHPPLPAAAEINHVTGSDLNQGFKGVCSEIYWVWICFLCRCEKVNWASSPTMKTELTSQKWGLWVSTFGKASLSPGGPAL